MTFAVGLCALTVAAALRAQEPDPPLADVAVAVAAYWADGDAAGIASVVAARGATLHLDDEDHPAASSRQVRAALEGLLGGGPTGSVRVEHTQRVGGTPTRGWAELGWNAAPAGARRPERLTIFVGFVEEQGRWRISEIRLLR